MEPPTLGNSDGAASTSAAAATATRPRRRGLRRRLTRLSVVTAVIAALGIGIFHRPLFLGNVGVVEPALVYRCAQPKGNLDELIETYQPASILNLRGGSFADDWYAAEVETTKQLGIDFYDYPIKATRRPSREELLTLIDLLERCRYPLLIHCKSGSDRTGLVSGLYLLTREGLPPDRALEAFSIWYGHVPIGGPQHLHEPFEEYRDWLQANGRTHQSGLFRSWVARNYRDERSEPESLQQQQPQPQPQPITPLSPGPRYGTPPPGWFENLRASQAD